MKRILLSLGLVFWSFSALAESKGTVLFKTLTVYEQPAGKSEKLVQVKKGTALTVMSQRGGWYQVRVKLQKGFVLTGWVDRRGIKSAKAVPTYAEPAPARRAVPAATPTPAAQFAEMPAPRPTPSASLPPPRPTPAASRVMAEESPSGGLLGDKLELGVDAGFLLYQYSLKNSGAASDLFGYNLAGFGFGVAGKYWFWDHWDRAFRVGSELNFQYGMYNLTTLTVNTGTETLKAKSSNTSMDIVLRVPAEYRFGDNAKSPKVGLFAGFEYFKFNANDKADSTGAKINLFVGQTTISFPIGLYGSYVFADRYALTLGGDVLPLNFVSESPGNATGTSPSAGMGLIPWLKFAWLLGDHNELGLDYRFRMQSFSFKGTASRIGTSNVTDGRASTKSHNVMLNYAYRF